MPLHHVSPLALKYGPWSFSKAETVVVCPSQFHHKYVLKTVPGRSTSDASVGTTAHSVLEHMTGGASFVDARKQALDTTPLTSPEIEALRALEGAIAAFMRRFDAFCRNYGVVKVFREEAWGFDVDYKAAGFFAPGVFFRGKVDLALLTKDHDLFIIDHKTGAPKDLRKDVKKRQQLNSYGVLALPHLPEIGGVRAGIHFLQAQDIPFLDYVSADLIRRAHVPWLFQFLNDAAENCVAPFPPKAKLRWPCEWCAYQSACPAFAEMTSGA